MDMETPSKSFEPRQFKGGEAHEVIPKVFVGSWVRLIFFSSYYFELDRLFIREKNTLLPGLAIYTAVEVIV